MDANGNMQHCEVLIDWLWVANICAGVKNQPWLRLATTAPVLPIIAMPQDNVALNNFCRSFIHQDIPNLQATPLMQGVSQITLGLGQLVTWNNASPMWKQTRDVNRKQTISLPISLDPTSSNWFIDVKLEPKTNSPKFGKTQTKCQKVRQHQVLEQTVSEALRP